MFFRSPQQLFILIVLLLTALAVILLARQTGLPRSESVATKPVSTEVSPIHRQSLFGL